MNNLTLSNPILQSIKKKLLAKAQENKKQDHKANRRYWTDVIFDIRTAKHESDFMRIALYDFGVNSLEEILTTGKEANNA